MDFWLEPPFERSAVRGGGRRARAKEPEDNQRNGCDIESSHCMKTSIGGRVVGLKDYLRSLHSVPSTTIDPVPDTRPLGTFLTWLCTMARQSHPDQRGSLLTSTPAASREKAGR